MRRWIAGVALCGLAGAAHADRADQLFKKGQKLLGEKRYAEACTAFEESDRLDPEIGAKLNVARCYQEWGKFATAWRWYTEAEQMAIKAGDKRSPKIHALIEELDRDVPRLTIVLPPDAITDHLVIQLDGVELALAAVGDERRVDPGPHEVTVVIDGKRRAKTVPVSRGEPTKVALDVPTRPRPQRPPPVEIADPGRTRRLIGLGASGAGVVALGIAGIVTLRARSDYQHALAGYCNGAIDMCDATGLTRTHSARHRANIATTVTVIGAATVAGGLVVYFTAPGAAFGTERRERAATAGHALYLAPAIGGDGTGVLLGGAF